MKRIWAIFLSCLAMLILSSFGFSNRVLASEALTYNHELVKGELKVGDSNLGGVIWSLSLDPVLELSEFDDSKGQVLGSALKPLKKATLKTSAFAGRISRININLAGGHNVDAKVDITVGGEKFDYGYKLSFSPVNYQFKGDAKGEILITIKNNTDALIYFKSISVTYTPLSLSNIETKASLRLKYNKTTNEAIAVDLRFGGIIPLELYNEANRYGVIAIPEGESFDPNNFDLTKVFHKEIKPVRVDSGYQLGLVLTNVPLLSYGKLIRGYIYLDDGKAITLAKPKEASVYTVTADYLTNHSDNPSVKEVIEVLNNIMATKPE